MRVLEWATGNLKRRISELGSLRNYLRQEEITEEMLEIISGGGFCARRAAGPPVLWYALRVGVALG